MRMRVWSLALLSRLRIWCCHKLRSGIAVAVVVAGSCSSDSTPCLRTSMYLKCRSEKKKKRMLLVCFWMNGMNGSWRSAIYLECIPDYSIALAFYGERKMTTERWPFFPLNLTKSELTRAARGYLIHLIKGVTEVQRGPVNGPKPHSELVVKLEPRCSDAQVFSSQHVIHLVANHSFMFSFVQ